MIWFIVYILIGLAIAILMVSSGCFQGEAKDSIQDYGFEGILCLTIAAGGFFLMWPMAIIWFIKGFIKGFIEGLDRNK